MCPRSLSSSHHKPWHSFSHSSDRQWQLQWTSSEAIKYSNCIFVYFNFFIIALRGMWERRERRNGGGNRQSMGRRRDGTTNAVQGYKNQSTSSLYEGNYRSFNFAFRPWSKNTKLQSIYFPVFATSKKKLCIYMFWPPKVTNVISWYHLFWYTWYNFVIIMIFFMFTYNW